MYKHGKAQTPKQEKKTCKNRKADKMGALLDSAEKIRKRKKSPSRKAHANKEKLEKNKNKGIKWH